jgi:hypothetical protein
MYGEYDDYCKHGKVRGHCGECRAEYEHAEAQKRHEESVARQKARLKIAPWNISDGVRSSE